MRRLCLSVLRLFLSSFGIFEVIWESKIPNNLRILEFGIEDCRSSAEPKKKKIPKQKERAVGFAEATDERLSSIPNPSVLPKKQPIKLFRDCFIFLQRLDYIFFKPFLNSIISTHLCLLSFEIVVKLYLMLSAWLRTRVLFVLESLIPKFEDCWESLIPK
uniref:Uncharacterized protein n=1 Tax=Pediastrum angulosum TaxID=271408 RepID=A0A2U8GHU1_9CHLO|nr:hypothetical protein [Pediastrum angulosum]YP_009492025.1 hypothetical protein [Pediastrum angulosum]AWI68148.1 hypothetical protein [Pediastrum angulosum]AWI68150.1 hypothetical protein [Pediastrum angulosum]